MNPHKILNSDDPLVTKYFCQESRDAFSNWPGSENYQSLNDCLRAINTYRGKEHVKKFISVDTVDTLEKWIRRLETTKENFDIAVIGGDLHPTNEWRVLEGTPIFEGTEEACRKYISGSHFTFKKGDEIVRKNDEWDIVINPEGRVGKSMNVLTQSLILQNKYYDAVDDYEIWRDV